QPIAFNHQLDRRIRVERLARRGPLRDDAQARPPAPGFLDRDARRLNPEPREAGQSRIHHVMVPIPWLGQIRHLRNFRRHLHRRIVFQVHLHWIATRTFNPSRDRSCRSISSSRFKTSASSSGAAKESRSSVIVTFCTRRKPSGPRSSAGSAFTSRIFGSNVLVTASRSGQVTGRSRESNNSANRCFASARIAPSSPPTAAFKFLISSVCEAARFKNPMIAPAPTLFPKLPLVSNSLTLAYLSASPRAVRAGVISSFSCRKR